MRVIESRPDYFLGTHKGARIEVSRDRGLPGHHFYICVRADLGEGPYLVDGYAPKSVTTLPEAKREALRAAGLARVEQSG